MKKTKAKTPTVRRTRKPRRQTKLQQFLEQLKAEGKSLIPQAKPPRSILDEIEIPISQPIGDLKNGWRDER